MSRAIEAFRSARHRINPEGLAASTTLSAVSPFTMIPMEAGVTYAIHEAANITDPNLLKLAVIGILGIANAVSVNTEVDTLRKKNYSASPVGSALNIATGKPLLSSIGEHAVNYAQLSMLNPINAVALINGDGRLLLESAGATSLALTIWLTSMNTLISQGRIDPVVNRIKKTRQTIWSKIRK
jgi:hypothetical protein